MNSAGSGEVSHQAEVGTSNSKIENERPFLSTRGRTSLTVPALTLVMRGPYTSLILFRPHSGDYATPSELQGL